MAGSGRSCVTVIEVLGGIADDRRFEGFDTLFHVRVFSVNCVCKLNAIRT